MIKHHRKQKFLRIILLFKLLVPQHTKMPSIEFYFSFSLFQSTSQDPNAILILNLIKEAEDGDQANICMKQVENKVRNGEFI